MIQERKCLQCGLIKNLNQFGRERCICVKCEKPRTDSLKYWGYTFGFVTDTGNWDRTSGIPFKRKNLSRGRHD